VLWLAAVSGLVSACSLVGYGTNDGLDGAASVDPDGGLDATATAEAGHDGDIVQPGADASTADAARDADAVDASAFDAQSRDAETPADSGQGDADGKPDAQVVDDAGLVAMPGCGEGESCAPTCAVGLCDLDCTDSESCKSTCARLTLCQIACSNGKDCELDCAPSATCTLACDDAVSCDSKCEAGSACKIDCSHAETCTATCAKGALCNIDCHSVGDCSGVSCEKGAACRVNCREGGDPAGKCELDCKDGTGASCSDGTLVCNVPC
jgi:hypothetical protein